MLLGESPVTMQPSSPVGKFLTYSFPSQVLIILSYEGNGATDRLIGKLCGNLGTICLNTGGTHFLQEAQGGAGWWMGALGS